MRARSARAIGEPAWRPPRRRADGARTGLFGTNEVDTVADGLYHLGFAIDGRRLLNEDGGVALAGVAVGQPLPGG